MQDLKQQIQNFSPYNEQETKDKEFFLKFIDTFNDCLTRENEFGHFTASAFVLNKERTKILMIYHKIFDAWGWMGGHADGDSDLLHVATKEAQEESGLNDIVPISEEILALDSLTVHGHMKKGFFIPAHIHFNAAYLLEADENEGLIVNETETDGVKWVPIEDMPSLSTESRMQELYKKAIEKMKKKEYV